MVLGYLMFRTMRTIYCVIFWLFIHPDFGYSFNAVPGEYIVPVPAGMTVAGIVRGVPGARVVTQRTIGDITILLMKVHSPAPPPADNHREGITPPLPHVRDGRIELFPNIILHTATPPPLSSPPQSRSQSAFSCHSQTFTKLDGSMWSLARISNLQKWTYQQTQYRFHDTGRDVNIYVMDSGVNVAHQTFGGRARRGFTLPVLLETEGDEDLGGHGTHMAALSAGCLHGVAKEASIIAVKVMNASGKANLDQLLDGLNWITSDINQQQGSGRKHVINMSLGGAFDGAVYFVTLMEQMFSAIPAIIVVAAGNEAKNACGFFPAVLSNVITVGGSDVHDKLLQKSNHGRCVNILAPGMMLFTASNQDSTSDAYTQGTSGATAIVSGMVARYLQRYDHQLSTKEMMKVLQDNGNKGKTNAAVTNTPDILLYFPPCSVANPPHPWSDCAKRNYTSLDGQSTRHATIKFSTPDTYIITQSSKLEGSADPNTWTIVGSVVFAVVGIAGLLATGMYIVTEVKRRRLKHSRSLSDLAIVDHESGV